MGTILFIFNIILAVNFITESSLSSLSQKVDIVLYITDSTTPDETQQMIKEFRMINGVTDVSYTSKEDALAKIKNMYPNIYQSFTKYDLANPLPASISVKTSDPTIHKTIENYLKGSRFSAFITNISNTNGAENSPESDIISSVAKNLEKVTEFSRQIIFWVIIVFVFGGILIILNAIQMATFTRRKEIQIMKLVGANFSYIKLPFIIEGVLYAIFSLILNLVLLSFLSDRIDIKDFNLSSLLIFELAITIILAICSSLLAVHNHLRKNI